MTATAAVLNRRLTNDEELIRSVKMLIQKIEREDKSRSDMEGTSLLAVDYPAKQTAVAHDVGLRLAALGEAKEALRAIGVAV